MLVNKNFNYVKYIMRSNILIQHKLMFHNFRFSLFSNSSKTSLISKEKYPIYEPGVKAAELLSKSKIIKKVNDQDKNALSFREFRFIPELYKVLDSIDILAPTSIQTVTIPRLMDKKHLFFASQTGTGKTLSFLLPIINELKLEEQVAGTRVTQSMRPRVLIIVPSRELSQQIEEVCKLFVYDAPLTVESFYVGKKFKSEKELSKNGIDILITTPERFKNHWSKNNVFITKLSHLVIDELDTLLDAGNEEFIKEITLPLLKKNETQIILASTTSTNSINAFLDELFLDIPNFVKLIDKSTNHNLSNVKHEFIHVSDYDKFPTLSTVIRDRINSIDPSESIIVFCNNVSCCRKTELQLKEGGFTTACLHGEIPPFRRRDELMKFKRKQARVLICTDLIARGMDFPFVRAVVNFDFPKTISDYLHRAGRTGRGGRKGTVISFYRNFNTNIIDKIKSAHQLNVPMEIGGSMFSIRKRIGESDEKHAYLQKRISPQKNLYKKETEEQTIIRLHKRKIALANFREKNEQNKDAIIRKLNDSNSRKFGPKRRANKPKSVWQK